MYRDRGGKLIYPYMEIIKKTADGKIHLLTVSFINERLKIEVYKDRAAFGDLRHRLMRMHFSKQRERQITVFER